MAKVDTPLSYVDEAKKINTIFENTSRTTTGNVTWTSTTSGITYNTSTSPSVVVKNCGELGLMNMLIDMYGTSNGWVLTAGDLNGKSEVNHTHGVIQGDTAGTESNKVLYTTTGGEIVAGAAPVAGGGTGKILVTSGALLKGNGVAALAELLGTGALYAETSGDPQFGVLPVSMGGTGQSTLAGLRNQLGLGSEIGVLSVANGGTGVSNLQALRNSLGLGNTLSAVPIANGGTGATDAASARNNLGAANKAHTHTGLEITTPVPITAGGTGANNKKTAKINLGFNNGTTAPSGGSDGDYYFQYNA